MYAVVVVVVVIFIVVCLFVCLLECLSENTGVHLMFGANQCQERITGLNSLRLRFVLHIILYVSCISRTVRFYMCIEYCV